MKSEPETEKIFVKHISDKLLICKIYRCVYIYTHRYMYIYTYTYIYTPMYIYIHIHMKTIQFFKWGKT